MKLHLREDFLTAKGEKRINNMTLKHVDDGCIQVWINNGEKYGTFRLKPENLAKLKQFLNEH
jgi:hypothetical protein